MPHQSKFFHTKRCGNIPTGRRLASNAGVIGTNHDGRVAGYRSTTAAVCDPQLTVLVYNSYGAGLFTEQIATHQWIRRKEQNRI